MIDKLDLRIPGSTPFAPGFGYLYADSRGDGKRWKKSQHYAAAAAWDDCGIEAITHIGCTMTAEPMHKLEILRAGEKTVAEMVELVTRVFDVDPFGLEIMRTDLTADVRDVPLVWFKRHCTVQRKQTRRELGTVEPYMQIGKGHAETLYSGVKPNQVRIYDKAAERRMQYRKYVNRLSKDSGGQVEPTPFETLYGHGMWDCITRVERQVAARDVEKLGLRTMRALQARADTLSPFERLVILPNRDADPRRENYSFADYHAGMWLQKYVEDFGLADALRYLRAQDPDNFKRAKKKYWEFLRVTDNVAGIDAAKLKQLYQASSALQLLRAA